MKKCGACGAVFRAAGTRAYVLGSPGRLKRTTVCPQCARSGILVVLSPATRDPPVCLDCHDEPAVIGHSCALRARSEAVRHARGEAMVDTVVAGARLAGDLFSALSGKKPTPQLVSSELRQVLDNPGVVVVEQPRPAESGSLKYKVPR